MATEEFAQLLGTSIEQWLATQAPVTGDRAQLTADSGRPSAAGAAPARTPRRQGRRRRAA